MAKAFYEYQFDTATTSISSYDSAKLNLGYIMKRSQDSSGRRYVSPLEPKFFRTFDVLADNINCMGAVEYTATKIWLFGVFWTAGTTKRFYGFEYDKANDTLTYLGSVVFTGNSGNNTPYQLNPTLDRHTAGTVSVSGTAVTGSGTSWKTDGACVGNRIGFGSTDSAQITTWYEISAIGTDGSITLTSSAGTISAGASYVIEDLRILYANYNQNVASTSGLMLVKGLRIELFSRIASNTVGFATTIDNIRAVYRLANAASSSYVSYAVATATKISFTEQYAYSVGGYTTSTSIQKFNIRAPLTLASGTSTNAFILSTGSQATSATGMDLLTTVCMATYSGSENIFMAFNNRIIRIPQTNVTSASTTFIADFMTESTPGGVNTYALTSRLRSIAWLPTANRFLVGTTGGGVASKPYLLQYSPGGSFERNFMLLDSLRNNSFASSYTDTLNCPQYIGDAGNYLDFIHVGGITFMSKYIASSSETILYTFPIEADELYESSTNACVITPEITTSNATALRRIWVYSEKTFNSSYTEQPREYYKIYYRTSGISGNSGSWTLVPQSGDLSGVTPASSIQFKITFRTAGLATIADKIYGLTLTYDTTNDPLSTTFYEPSIANSNPSSGIIAWRQRAIFASINIPDLTIKIYDPSNVLLLTDTTNSPTLGTWEYSNDGGTTWSAWTASANVIGNYIRYTPTSPVGAGQKVKIILFET